MTQRTVLSPTRTPEPTQTIAPTAVPPAETVPGQLVSRSSGSPPLIDGEVDALWEASAPLRVPLTWGAESGEHALDVEMRALHDEQTLYLLAQWPGERPASEAGVIYNQFTVHWRIPQPDAALLDCDVACHTVFADERGQVAYANAETIPHGGGQTLQIAGGWADGLWTVEWSRPRANGNPFDLQLADQDRGYAFMLKVFARVEGRPDPISHPQQLVFGLN